MSITILGLLLFSLLPSGTGNFYLTGVAVGFGLASLLGAPLRFAALEEGGKLGRGASQGLLTASLSVGRLFGASLTGGVAAAASGSVLGYRRAMLVIAIAGCAALLTSKWLRRR
jgi:predicted MFS family arabinose efflux permease